VLVEVRACGVSIRDALPSLRRIFADATYAGDKLVLPENGVRVADCTPWVRHEIGDMGWRAEGFTLAFEKEVSRRSAGEAEAGSAGEQPAEE
jgi:hypothetical protein